MGAIKSGIIKPWPGFTMLELLVVIAIVGVLVAMAVINYENLSRKAKIESEIKTLYSDLMKQRALAIARSRNVGIRLHTATQYSEIDDRNEDGDFGDTGEAILKEPLKNSIMWRSQVPDNDDIVFSSSGITTDTGTISIQNNVGAEYDCIVIHFARTNIGRLNNGQCVAK